MNKLKTHAIVTAIFVLLAWFIFENEWPTQVQRCWIVGLLLIVNWFTFLLNYILG